MGVEQGGGSGDYTPEFWQAKAAHLTTYLKATYGVTMSTTQAINILKAAHEAGQTVWTVEAVETIGNKWYRKQSSSGGADTPTTDGGGGGTVVVGGGGSSAPVYDKAAAKAAFIEKLREWGLSPQDGHLDNLVAQAVNKKWTIYEFIQAVRKTKPYALKFKGIDWRNGMTEGEYIRLYKRYEDLYRNYGFRTNKVFTPEMFGKIIKNGVSPEEFTAKVDALERMEDNRDLLNAFKQELLTRGLVKGKTVSKKEMVAFTLGQGDPRWEAVWEMAAASAGAEVAGIQISRSDIKGLIKQIEGAGLGEVEDLTQDTWNQLASAIGSIPDSQLRAYKLTKSDVILAQFGLGNKRGQVQQVLANLEAESDPSRRVNPQLYEQEPGSTVLSGGAPAPSRSL